MSVSIAKYAEIFWHILKNAHSVKHCALYTLPHFAVVATLLSEVAQVTGLAVVIMR
jgi:hypothetical protein